MAFKGFLKESTAFTAKIGPFVDDADGNSEETGLTIAQADVRLSKNGGNMAQKNDATSCTHDEIGIYDCPINATDTNAVGVLDLYVHEAGALLVHHTWYVLETAIFDALFGSAAAGFDANGRVDLGAWVGVAPLALVSQRVDATAILQDAAVDAIWDEILTGATHNVVDSAGRRIRVLEENGSYNGAIWIDTVNGTAGTTDFENGTDHNPVNNIADANTLAASIGLSRFNVAPGSSITFAAAQQNQEFSGTSWTLALGGQDIANTTIMGAEVSGVGVGTGSQHFISCSMGAVTLPDDTHVQICDIIGTQTLPAGDIFYDRCHSGVLGTGSPQFDFGAVPLNTDLHIRNYSGGVDLRNMGQAGTDDAEIEGRGNVTVNVNCIGGTIEIRGNFNLTDNGSATITDLARYDSGSLVDDIFDEDVVAAHGTADTAGLLLRALGALISQRSNNPTLDALLGVADSAGNDVPNQVLDGDTMAELTSGIPAATPTLRAAIMLFYMMSRNEWTSSATLLEIFNDAGVVIAKKTITDAAGKYTEDEAVSGP